MSHKNQRKRNSPARKRINNRKLESAGRGYLKLQEFLERTTGPAKIEQPGFKFFGWDLAMATILSTRRR